MDYSKMTIVELRTLAKEKGVKSTTTLNKAGLVAALENIDRVDEKPATREPAKVSEVKTLYTERTQQVQATTGVQYANRPQMRQPEHSQRPYQNSSHNNYMLNQNQYSNQGQSQNQQSYTRPVRSLTSEEVKQNMIAAVNAITSNKEMA